jgi:sugar lactone lactonase YvrE
VAVTRLGVELACELTTELGEGPVWDERRQVLFLVDLTGKGVLAYTPGTGERMRFDLDRSVGCVVIQENGDLLIAAEDVFMTADADGTGLARFGTFAVAGSRLRFNDGKVDPAGRLVVGTMEWAGQHAVGSLLLLDHDGAVRTILEGTTISNGLAWSADGSTLYFVDTPLRTLDAFDFDATTGALSNRREVARFEFGRPDGIAIDDAGNLWVAEWGGRCVECVEPSTGRHLALIDVPASNVASVAFGGPHLDNLYVTTARYGLDPQQLASETRAGDLFVAMPGVTGPTANRFVVISDRLSDS